MGGSSLTCQTQQQDVFWCPLLPGPLKVAKLHSGLWRTNGGCGQGSRIPLSLPLGHFLSAGPRSSTTWPRPHWIYPKPSSFSLLGWSFRHKGLEKTGLLFLALHRFCEIPRQILCHPTLQCLPGEQVVHIPACCEVGPPGNQWVWFLPGNQLVSANEELAVMMPAEL